MASNESESARRSAVKEENWATGAQKAKAERRRLQASHRRQSWIRKRIKSSSEGAKFELQPEPVDLRALNAAIRDIQARSASKNLAGLTALREMLSHFDAPYEDIVKRHAVTYLCELLQHPDDDIKAEASWCLVNLSAASVEYAAPVLKAVPALTTYLEAADVRLNEHACWCLGNLAGEDGEEFTTVLTATGVVVPLISLIRRFIQQPRTQQSVCFQVAWWCLANLSRHLRFAPWVSEHNFAGALLEAAQSADQTVRCEAWWAIVHAVAEQGPDCQTLISAGLLPAAMTVITSTDTNPQALLPTIRTLGHLSASHWLLTTESDLVAILRTLLEVLLLTDESATLKEGAWAMNNLMTLCLEARPQLLPAIAQVARRLLLSSRLDIQKEGVIALANVSDLPELSSVVAEQPAVLNTTLDLLAVNDRQIQTGALVVLRNCAAHPIRCNIEAIRSRAEQLRSLIDLDTHKTAHALTLEILQSLLG